MTALTAKLRDIIRLNIIYANIFMER